MSKELKQIRKMKKKLEARENAILQKERLNCRHGDKHGTWFEIFKDGGIEKQRCRECGIVYVSDPEVMNRAGVEDAVAVVRTALAEALVQSKQGKIDLSKDTRNLIKNVDAEILGELPELIENITGRARKGKKDDWKVKDKKGKNKDKKKKKKKRRKSY